MKHFYAVTGDLNQIISDFSLDVVMWGAIALVLLVGAAMAFNNRYPKVKPWLFGLILLVVIGTTLSISGATVYLNMQSASKGPVHWHADFEVWACDNELELRNPAGMLSNKIGSPTYHEHNDKRIHLEGVPVTLPHDASLGYFMETIGGGLAHDSLTVPLNSVNYFADAKGKEDGDGPAKNLPDNIVPYVKTGPDGTAATFISGQTCGGQTAEVQVFVYHFDAASRTYSQKKLSNPVNYAIRKEEAVPPGDCVIIEFAPSKTRTNKLCKQYGIKDNLRCHEFGVPESRRSSCDIREVAG